MSPAPVRASRSFEAGAAHSATLPGGQVAHAAHIAHDEVLARRFYAVRPGVWCLVGNGLSNQTFIEAPDGIIAIDTGESVQEMQAALDELRAVSDRPIVAVLYTHFHYVSGTRAIIDEHGPVPVYGHERIALNRARAGAEIGPTYGRGVAEQFGLLLPADGPDGLVNVGLGRFFRDPAHAPYTPGHVPVDHPFADACTLHVAGLQIDVQPAPSDADDSVTFWFPSLGVAVHNIVWPALFNVFAIRTEEYRDPRVLLTGLDHLLSLGAEHLVGAHGPPISGPDTAERVTRYRDSIQYIWDQTVRHTNRGLTSSEVGHAIRLPDHCDDDYITSELYGVAEHHVRQVRAGLFGFFDGDEANLFPTPRVDRADRMIAGFGGRDTVRAQVAAAIDADDLRWAVELAGWLAHSTDATAEDRTLLARAIRLIGQRTSSANIRSWCLTRARHLEGTADNSRLYTHRFPRAGVMANPVQSVHVLRVVLDPNGADGIDGRLAWRFVGGTTAGLHVRNCVAVPTDGTGDADATIECEPAVWADVLAGAITLGEVVERGDVHITGAVDLALRALACFDAAGLRA